MSEDSTLNSKIHLFLNFIKEQWKKNLYFRLSLLFIIFYFVGTVGIYIYENRAGNPDFSDFYESCWSTLVYVVSGFDVGTPKTFPGRVFSILILMSSVGILGLIVGQFTTILLQGKVVRMPKNVSKHIVICNWNEKGEKIVEELHSSLAAPDIGIIVISKPRPVNEEELRRNFPQEFSNVEFREGSPMTYETLKCANVYLARSVIILADDKSSEPDAQSGLIALAINTLWKKNLDEEIEKRIKFSASEREEILHKLELEKKYNKPRIIVEVLDHLKMQHLKDAGADDVICAADYAIGIIAQSSINEKLSDVYHDLLTYSPGTNEIFILDEPEISAWTDGKTFKEVSIFFLEHRCSVNPAIPIGLRRGAEAIVNPKDDIKFISDDALIVLAYDVPDVVKIIHSNS